MSCDLGTINILDLDGYNDGYYWDYRVYFEHNGEPYTYIRYGSGSGYISCYIGIKHGNQPLEVGDRTHDNLSNDWTIENLSKPSTLYMLYKAVQLLKESGEDEVELSEDDVDFSWDIFTKTEEPVAVDDHVLIIGAAIEKVIETRAEALAKSRNRIKASAPTDYITGCFNKYTEDKKFEKIDKLNDTVENCCIY